MVNKNKKLKKYFKDAHAHKQREMRGALQETQTALVALQAKHEVLQAQHKLTKEELRIHKARETRQKNAKKNPSPRKKS